MGVRQSPRPHGRKRIRGCVEVAVAALCDGAGLHRTKRVARGATEVIKNGEGLGQRCCREKGHDENEQDEGRDSNAEHDDCLRSFSGFTIWFVVNEELSEDPGRGVLRENVRSPARNGCFCYGPLSSESVERAW